jgi:hypothetical protein
MRQVERHHAFMRQQRRGVNLEVCGGSRVRLDVDAPFLGVQLEGLQSTLLAQTLSGVDELIAAVVAGKHSNEHNR